MHLESEVKEKDFDDADLELSKEDENNNADIEKSSQFGDQGKKNKNGSKETFQFVNLIKNDPEDNMHFAADEKQLWLDKIAAATENAEIVSQSV